jgi:hypothetical protein
MRRGACKSGRGRCGWLDMGMRMRRKEAVLFVTKKNQKNFDLRGAVATPSPSPPVSKSFLLLFFKKAALSSLASFS